MSDVNTGYLAQATDCWNAGKPLEAGRLIFENLPPAVRPKWASRILTLLIERTRVSSPAVDRVLQISRNPDQWHEAHQAFSGVRRLVLELDAMQKKEGLSEEQNLLGDLLSTAELVAKVTYNATDPPDEFDEDSGWWLPVAVKEILDSLKDDRFSEYIWFALCHEGDTEGCR